ncbi:MAG: discoidin domain-containing protein [Verrucomicrobiota bacterium]
MQLRLTNTFPSLRFHTWAATLLSVFVIHSAAANSTNSWMGWLSPEWRRSHAAVAQTEEELRLLGNPVVGQTVTQFGYVHPRLSAPPPVSPWVQIDLGAESTIDWIALIPAQTDWQSVERPSYGFPLRFRIDVSNDALFGTFTTIASYEEVDLADPGIAPVSVNAGATKARFVRLTVTKLTKENGQFFFALGEIMVLSGNRNIANGSKITASAATNFPPRWALQYLVDGRTALGPPIRKEFLPYDGLYSGPDPTGAPPWIMVDLGALYPIQEIRLHPIHARFGADIPGFSFPRKMKVEADVTAEFSNPKNLVSPEDFEFSNPGNNALTLGAYEFPARYVRVTTLDGTSPRALRFGFSELEVYSGGQNVALGKTVSTTGDPANMSRNWPLAQLVDGYTSYGKLMELPEWLAEWSKRTALEKKLSEQREHLAQQQELLQQNLWRYGLGLVGILIVGGIASAATIAVRSRRRRESELRRLRLQFAHDLHDEIGSNLAAMSVISQLARSMSESENQENWEEIHRITQESNEALREVLWVSGARQEMGADFCQHLQKAAHRMLTGRQVRWLREFPEIPKEWPLENRRQVFLFFKEVLANIVRHSEATDISLQLDLSAGQMSLEISDNGCGFESEASKGTGLDSLKQRAALLGGRLEIRSDLGRGTTVLLVVPVLTENNV